MSQGKILITSILAVLLTAGTLFYMAPDSDMNYLTKDQSLKCVARSTMISRGQNWVDKHVPYNQGGSYDGYRTDCSGFVSMCWMLPTPGHTTSTLPTVSTTIGKEALQPGDAILCPGTHVVLFGGWADSSHFVGMQEANSSTGTIKRTIPYPYWDNVGCYHPVRYNGVC